MQNGLPILTLPNNCTRLCRQFAFKMYVNQHILPTDLSLTSFIVTASHVSFGMM